MGQGARIGVTLLCKSRGQNCKCRSLVGQRQASVGMTTQSKGGGNGSPQRLPLQSERRWRRRLKTLRKPAGIDSSIFTVLCHFDAADRLAAVWTPSLARHTALEVPTPQTSDIPCGCSQVSLRGGPGSCCFRAAKSEYFDREYHQHSAPSS